MPGARRGRAHTAPSGRSAGHRAVASRPGSMPAGVTGPDKDDNLFLRRVYALARAAAVLARDFAVTGTRRVSLPAWREITTSRQRSWAAGASRRPGPRASEAFLRAAHAEPRVHGPPEPAPVGGRRALHRRAPQRPRPDREHRRRHRDPARSRRAVSLPAVQLPRRLTGAQHPAVSPDCAAAWQAETAPDLPGRSYMAAGDPYTGKTRRGDEAGRCQCDGGTVSGRKRQSRRKGQARPRLPADLRQVDWEAVNWARIDRCLARFDAGSLAVLLAAAADSPSAGHRLPSLTVLWLRCLARPPVGAVRAAPTHLPQMLAAPRVRPRRRARHRRGFPRWPPDARRTSPRPSSSGRRRAVPGDPRHDRLDGAPGRPRAAARLTGRAGRLHRQ